MKTVVIAEAGVNHNGNLSLAFDLIDAASAAGADIIKFQTFRAKQLASDFAQQATYQQKTAASQYKNQLEMLKKLELDHDDYLQLVDYCKVRKIGFLSSAFDHESLDFLASLKPSLWKIPSGEITNLPYLRKVSSFCQPVFRPHIQVAGIGRFRRRVVRPALPDPVLSSTPVYREPLSGCRPVLLLPVLSLLLIRCLPGIRLLTGQHTSNHELGQWRSCPFSSDGSLSRRSWDRCLPEW